MDAGSEIARGDEKVDDFLELGGIRFTRGCDRAVTSALGGSGGDSVHLSCFFAKMSKMQTLPALIDVDPEKGGQDTNTDAESEESFKVKVWHIRVMHPRLEPVVHFLARWWWPWSYTLLIVAMALAIIFDRPGVAVGFSLAQIVWV